MNTSDNSSTSAPFATPTNSVKGLSDTFYHDDDRYIGGLLRENPVSSVLTVTPFLTRTPAQLKGLSLRLRIRILRI